MDLDKATRSLNTGQPKEAVELINYRLQSQPGVQPKGSQQKKKINRRAGNLLALQGERIMEKTEKKKVKVIRVVCLQECADDKVKYERGERYSLPEDHPCMEYFQRVRFVTDPGQLGPADVEMAKGKEDG